MTVQADPLIARTLSDLKRRKVFRVAGAYGVVAWLLIEVTSVVLPALRLPEWTVTAVVICALAGFPVTLLLAWLFDLTSEGVVRTRPVAEGAAEVRRVARRGIDFVVIGVLLVIIAYLLFHQGSSMSRPMIGQSIAVLPFVDLSESGDNEYFSDGISEELLNSLVGIEGLRVAARTSSFAFKGRQEDVRVIGEKLNVGTVLEGSVRRAGDQVRIAAQLVDVRDGFPIWSETYSRRLDDIFAIQGEIARSIAEALKLELTGQRSAGQQGGPTGSIEAYDLYLLGRHHWHRRTPESLRRALDMFQQAVERDPEFALAHTGMADTYLLLDGYGDLSTEEAVAWAEPSVTRALALDADLAEAHASLGLLRLNQGDGVSAERALRRAIELNPNSSMAHMWLGLVLDGTTGPLDSTEEFRRAYQLDPLHPVVNQNLVRAYASVGRLEDAQQLLLAMTETDPVNPAVFPGLARLNRSYGRLDQAVQWALRGTREPSPAGSQLELALALLELGDMQRAEEVLDTAERNTPGKIDVAWARVQLYLAAGQIDELGYLGDSLVDDDASGKHEAAIRVLKGLAAILSGDPRRGVDDLQVGLEKVEGYGMDMPDGIGWRLVLAYGYGLLGKEALARESLTMALERTREARLSGWAIPRLAAWEAVALNMAGRSREAYDSLDAAVASGWRGYGTIRYFPPAADLFAAPGAQVAVAQVKGDLARMAANIAGLDAGQAKTSGRIPGG